MDWYYHFFQTGPIPSDAMYGEYNIYIVFLSYLIATFASYVALDMSAHLRRPTSMIFRICWLAAGAFAMGAGIWSMHFVGMLAFIMPMPMGYDLFWTGLSMLVAIATAAIAFVFFIIKNPRPRHYLLSGVILGAAIPTMHYTGMTGMSGVKIHYIPSLFYVSILIAVVAATASIWLSIKSDQGEFKKRFAIKLSSAFIMGFAIVSMHYTGMFAAVFTPLEHNHSMDTPVDQILLALFITTIVISILMVALILSSAKYFLYTIEKNKNFLKAVLDNMRGGVIACDRHGQINLSNYAADHLFGKNNSDLLKNWVENHHLYYDKTDKPGELKDFPLYRALQGEVIRDTEVVLKEENGKKHILLCDGQPLIGTDNEDLGALIVLNDISSSAAAEHASKVKTTFLANMSHEIRTPLNGVMGMLQLLMNTPLNEKQERYVNKSFESATTLLKILGDILDFSKIESGKISFENIAFDFENDLDTLMLMFRAQCEPKLINITLVLDDSIPSSMIGDPTKIKQILNNLVNNAIKFTPKGGKIFLKIRLLAIDEFTVTLEISVTDTGIGIPLKSQESIFNMFSQADESTARKYGGTGLGLAITKQLIELMGGELKIKSKEGEGSTFIFTLKLGYKNTIMLPEVLEKKEKIENHAILNVDVLMVEDNVLNQAVALEMLTSMGCKVDIADSGESALQFIQRKKYDLILMDCQIPGMDGFTTSMKIREKEKNTSENERKIIIAVTANALKGTRERCFEAGMDDYLTKPLNFTLLKNTLQKHLNYQSEDD